EMLEREVSDGAIIGLEPRQRRDEGSGADIDKGDMVIGKSGGDGGGVDARNNDVAIPAAETGGRLVAAIMLGKNKWTGTVFAGGTGNDWRSCVVTRRHRTSSACRFL